MLTTAQGGTVTLSGVGAVLKMLFISQGLWRQAVQVTPILHGAGVCAEGGRAIDAPNMKTIDIIRTAALIGAFITIFTTAAAALSCDCDDICVSTNGWRAEQTDASTEARRIAEVKETDGKKNNCRGCRVSQEHLTVYFPSSSLRILCG